MAVVDVAVLSILVGTILPIIVGVVTKQMSSSTVKAVILMFLSAVTGLVNGAINAGGLFTQEAVIGAGLAWITAVATYMGFLKPSGASDKISAKAWPERGLGKAVVTSNGGKG